MRTNPTKLKQPRTPLADITAASLNQSSQHDPISQQNKCSNLFQENNEPSNKPKTVDHGLSQQCILNCVEWNVKVTSQTRGQRTMINECECFTFDNSQLNHLKSSEVLQTLLDSDRDQRGINNQKVGALKDLSSLRDSCQPPAKLCGKIKLPLMNDSVANLMINSPVINSDGKQENLQAKQGTTFVLLFQMLDTEPSHQFLRKVDQKVVDDNLTFFVNGSVHGRRVFSKDLMYSMRGKKFIKSIQDKVDKTREFQILNDYAVHKRTDYWLRLLNLQLNMAFQVSIKRFNQGLNEFSTNFNKIVTSGGKVKRFAIQFVIPGDLMGLHDPQPVQIQRPLFFPRLAAKEILPTETAVGISNLERFLTCTTPLYVGGGTQTVQDLIDSFQQSSTLGAQVPWFMNEGVYKTCSYSPVLSAIEFNVDYNKQKILNDVLEETNTDATILERPSRKNLFQFVKQTELCPPHLRLPLALKLNQECAGIKNVGLTCLTPNSWIGVLWVLNCEVNKGRVESPKRDFPRHILVVYSMKGVRDSQQQYQFIEVEGVTTLNYSTQELDISTNSKTGKEMATRTERARELEHKLETFIAGKDVEVKDLRFFQ